MEDISTKKTEQFPCASCGAFVEFDPETQSLKCSYCGNITKIEEIDNEITEHDFTESLDHEPKENWQGHTKLVKCEKCGGETVLESSATADVCSFCGSAHVVSMSEFKGIRPESLIPFSISRKQVGVLFKKWISKKPFAPGSLKKEYRGDKIKGVYIPYWTYDSNTFSAYTADAGTYYYVTESYTVMVDGRPQRRTRQVRKTRWRRVSGTYPRFFNDILVNASNSSNRKLVSGLEPFRIEGLVPYKPEYLSGFSAERYAVGLKEGWEHAREEAVQILRREITRQINADEVRNLVLRTSYSDIKYRHTLFPIWISSYIYRNKSFSYMVNGQTGRFSGKAPVSIPKVILAVALTILLIILAVYLLRASGLLEGSSYIPAM
ncbi:MAG: hypothetical protein JXB33_03455 [Clostridia bacterium]|nr:hypothetical protein [Clostridia bacterium]